ncbi:MAG TPA: DUF1345 domain-containing protein [Methylibium sp.]
MDSAKPPAVAESDHASATTSSLLRLRRRGARLKRRLGLAFALGLAGMLLMRLAWPWTEAALAGWVVFVVADLALAWRELASLTAAQTRASVESNDQSSPVLRALVLLGCAASLGAIALLLFGSHQLPLVQRLSAAALAMLAIGASWLMIHVHFAMRYAHRYYRHPAASPAPLQFPGAEPPDFLDFFYFSFVIGMTSQVSDVTIQERGMRRSVLVHSLLSFGFNLMILALAINALASAF